MQKSSKLFNYLVKFDHVRRSEKFSTFCSHSVTMTSEESTIDEEISSNSTAKKRLLDDSSKSDECNSNDVESKRVSDLVFSVFESRSKIYSVSGKDGRRNRTAGEAQNSPKTRDDGTDFETARVLF